MKKGLIYYFLVVFILSGVSLIGCSAPYTYYRDKKETARLEEMRKNKMAEFEADMKEINQKYGRTTPTTSYIPECPTENQIISEQGRKPDDFFYCKNDQGHLVPTAKMIAYYDNDTVLVIGLDLKEDRISQRKDCSMDAYRIYRYQTAYVAGY